MTMHLHRRTLLQLLDHNAYSISPTSTITTCTCVFLPLRYNSRRRRFSASTRRRQGWNPPPGGWNNNNGSGSNGNGNGNGWNQNSGWTAPWQTLPNHNQSTQPQQQQQPQQPMQPQPWNINTVPNRQGWHITPPPMPPMNEAQGWNPPPPDMNQNWSAGENIPNYPGWGVPWQPKPQQPQRQEQEQPQGDQQWTFTSNMPAQEGYLSPLEMEQRRNMPVAAKEEEIDTQDAQSFGARTLSQKELLMAQQMFEQELEQQQQGLAGSDYGDVEGGNLDSWRAGETYDIDAGQSSEGNLGKWQSQEVYDSDIDQGSEVENQSEDEQGYDQHKMEQQSAVYYNQSFDPDNNTTSLNQQPKEWQQKLSDWVESTLPSGIQGAGTLAQKLMAKYRGWDNPEALSPEGQSGQFYNEQQQQWESMEWNFPETASFARNLMAKYGIGDPMLATGYEHQQYYTSPAGQEYGAENMQGIWQYASVADDFSTLSLAQNLNARRGQQMRGFSSDATAGQGAPPLETPKSQDTEVQTNITVPAVPPPANWKSEIPINAAPQTTQNLAERLKKRHTSRSLSDPGIPDITPLPAAELDRGPKNVIFRPHLYKGLPGLRSTDVPEVPRPIAGSVRDKLKLKKAKGKEPPERIGLPTSHDRSNKLARTLGTKLQAPGQRKIDAPVKDAAQEPLVGEFELPKEGWVSMRDDQKVWPEQSPEELGDVDEGLEVRRIQFSGLPLVRPTKGDDPDPEYQYKFYMNQKLKDGGPTIRTFGAAPNQESREKLKFQKAYIAKMLQKAQAMSQNNPKRKAMLADLRREYNYTVSKLRKTAPLSVQAKELLNKRNNLIAARNAAQAQDDSGGGRAELIKDLTNRIDGYNAQIEDIVSNAGNLEWDGEELKVLEKTKPFKKQLPSTAATDARISEDHTVLSNEIDKRSIRQEFSEVEFGQVRRMETGPVVSEDAAAASSEKSGNKSHLYPQSVDLSSVPPPMHVWKDKEHRGANAGALTTIRKLPGDRVEPAAATPAEESNASEDNVTYGRTGPIIHQYFQNPKGEALSYSKSAANAVLNSLHSRGDEGDNIISNIQDGKLPPSPKWNNATQSAFTNNNNNNNNNSHNALRPLRDLSGENQGEQEAQEGASVTPENRALWSPLDKTMERFSNIRIHTTYDYDENPFVIAEQEEKLKVARLRSRNLERLQNSEENDGQAHFAIRWSNKAPVDHTKPPFDEEEDGIGGSRDPPIRRSTGLPGLRRTTARALTLYYQFQGEGEAGKEKLRKLVEIYPDLARQSKEKLIVSEGIVRPILPSAQEHALKAQIEQEERLRHLPNLR